MRKALIGVITGALFFAAVGVALALTNNTADYTATSTNGAKNKLGRNITYNGKLHVGTTDNKQPNTASVTDVFYASQYRNNARYFPTCKASEINGQANIPAKCAKATVGSGSATALVGQPGATNSPQQQLSVVVVNGTPKGKNLMLALKGGALTTYRVIPGNVTSAPKPFGYKVSFAVPSDLQNILGSQIALTDFNVTVDQKKKATVKIKVKKGKKKVTKKVKVTLLQIKKCPASKTLPVKAVVHFNNDDGSPGGQTFTDESTQACK